MGRDKDSRPHGTAPRKNTRVEDEGEDVTATQPGQLHPALNWRVAIARAQVLEAAFRAVAIVLDLVQVSWPARGR